MKKRSLLAKNPGLVERLVGNDLYASIKHISDNMSTLLHTSETILNMTASTGPEGSEAEWDAVNGVLTIPRGDTGEQGIQGEQGIPGEGALEALNTIVVFGNQILLNTMKNENLKLQGVN